MASGPGLALVRQAGGYDEDFKTLIVAARPVFVSMAARYVGMSNAEDVVQDAYLRAWRYLPAFKGDSSLRTWVHTIVRNQALMTLREAKVRPHGQDTTGLDFVATFSDSGHSQRATDAKILVDQIVNALSSKRRKLIKEHLADGGPGRKVRGVGRPKTTKHNLALTRVRYNIRKLFPEMVTRKTP